MRFLSTVLSLFLSVAVFAQCPVVASTGNTSTYGHASGLISTIVDPSITVDASMTTDVLKIFIEDGFVTGDVLSHTGTLPTGVTSSYENSSGVLTISGATMTATEIQAVFRAVEISSTNTSVSTRKVVFVLGNALPLSTNGHYYEFVSSPQILWTVAKTQSDAKTYFGLQGYLATITSADETNFLLQKVAGDGWIGANDVATNNTWQWVTGPEAGTSFWQGTVGGSPIAGAYTNWNTNQPDNAGGVENWMQFYKNGTSADGKWNDLTNTAHSIIAGYLVEYGGMPGDPTCGPSTEKTVSFLDPDADTDGDGLSDANEILIGSDPNLFEDNDGDGISDHFDPDDDNDGIIDAIECGSVTVLVNGGFDDGPSFNMQDQSTVPGWNTTASDGKIEIWPNPFINAGITYAAVEGPGQAELNANVVGALYQTVNTTPGQKIIWSVYHRKRGSAGAAAEILNVKVSSGTSLSSSSTLYTSTAVNGVWSFYSGVYTIPAGQTTTTFFFEGAGGSGSFGNLIDEISFSEPSNSCLQDTDGDGTPDSFDTDADNDGIPDATEGSGDTDGDGIPDYLDTDSDGDGIPDATEGSGDTDGDGIPDYLDTDSDGDGIPDATEGSGDTDGDGIPDYLDTDSDGDGIPDATEGSGDTDGDGIPDYLDTDSDGDGIPDATEGSGDTDGDGIPDYLDTDSDGDGIPDATEGSGDTDGDGIPDYLDTDSDGDGIPDATEGSGDTDGDGIPDYLDTDSDGDGIPDATEGSGDTDGDGIPDYLDTDSDGDGIPDATEGSGDTDGDGIPDYLDTDSDGDGIPDSSDPCPYLVDIIDPTITPPVAVTVNVDAGACGTALTNVSLGTPTTTDNCIVASTTNNAPTSFPLGNTTVTWTVTDGSGNTATATQVVTVVDDIDPVAVAQDITVALDVNGAASITTSDIDNGSSDNCSFTLALNVTSFDCDDLGANTVTLTATDGSGNTHDATATVTVVDNIDPTITAPVAVTVNVDAGACSTALTNVTLGTPTTADNCSVASTTNDAPTSFPLGATTVTWTVTDGSGNTATATQEVTVVDNIDPTITAPVAVTVNVDAGACSTALTNVTLGTPTTADNCSVASTTNDAPTSFPLGATTVTWTVTDGSGNTATATQVVTVVDNIDPTITAPVAVTVNVDAGACSTALTNVTLGTPTTADNCSVASTTNDAPTSFPLGATTVTWTVTDGSGNTATASQVVTVVDNIDPVLSCPPNMVVYGAADSTLTSVSWTAATATDNCTIDTVYSDVQIGAFLPLGSTTVTYVAIDGSGNTDTCSFNISVVDTVSPVITGCPSPITQNNDTDSCGAVVSWTAPVFYDNSDYFTVTASHASGDYFPVGTTTVTITVSDSSGNSTECEFDVTVTDNQVPYVVPFNNVSITLGTDGMYSLAVASVDSASYDNCGIANRYLTDAFFNCNDVPSATTWLVVEDIHGNKDSALVNVQVSLPATPVLSVVSTVSDVLCYGDSTGFMQAAVSGGVSPYTYNWSNGSTTFEATNLPIGTYWYEVTDTNGCYTTDTLVMNEPTPLMVSTVKSVYPGGYNVSINGTSDGSITTTASGGITPYSFDWNSGAFVTQNLTGVPAGVYALVMTDSNGCAYNLTDTLTEPTALIATATSLQSVICPDDTAGIVLGAASGAVPPYTYSWDFGSTTDYNTGLSYGIYTVTVTDTNGAVATDTVLVDALDYDCDGIYNVDEGGTPNGGGGDGDVDGDGIPNEEDLDSDGDGLLDSEEFDYDNDGVGFDDCDGDGIPNFLDPDLCDLLVPAVFTPNGDGDNDYWEILGIRAFPDNNVQVFNRWGELVYTKEGYNNEFNGEANTNTFMNGGDGLLPTGTYYYIVKVYETGDTYTGYLYITK